MEENKEKASSVSLAETYLRVIAKHSISLHLMSRDMNVAKINFQKLVELEGGKVRKDPDAMFLSEERLEKSLSEEKEKLSPEKKKKEEEQKEKKKSLIPEKIGKKIEGIKGKAVNIFDKLKVLFSPKNFMKVLGKIALPLLILTTLWEGLTGAWEAYQETGSIWEAFKGGIGQIVEFFTFGLIDKKMVSEFFDNLADFFKPVVDAIKTFFGDIGKWVGNKFDAVVSLFQTKEKAPKSDTKTQSELAKQAAEIKKEEDRRQKEAAEEARKVQEERAKSIKEKRNERIAQAKQQQAQQKPAPIVGGGGKTGGAGATATFEKPSTAPKAKEEKAPIKKPSSPGFESGKKEMLSAMDKEGIKDPKARAQILAQTAKESGGFKYTQELGNEKYFEKYEGRKDLGNVNPGDGLKFIGRGFLQTTGRVNYQQFKDEFGVDVISDPSLLAKPEYAAMSALFWFKKNDKKVKKLSNGDWSNTEGVTRAVNGGLNGLDDRKKYFDLFKDDPDVTGVPSNVIVSGTGEPIRTGSGGFLTTTQQETKKETKDEMPKGSGDDQQGLKYPESGSARLTSLFGYRNLGGKKEFHPGVDYAGVPKGTPIQLKPEGKVVGIDISGYGKSYDILVNGEILRFGHMDQRLFNDGDKIPANSIIGTIGSTGHSTGDHLHFEHRKDRSGKTQEAMNKTYDPLKSGAVSLIGIGDKPLNNEVTKQLSSKVLEGEGGGGLDSSGSKIAANSIDLSASQRQQQKPQTPIIVNAPTTNNTVIANNKNVKVPQNKNTAGALAAAAA